jgi:hypothetical protein
MGGGNPMKKWIALLFILIATIFVCSWGTTVTGSGVNICVGSTVVGPQSGTPTGIYTSTGAYIIVQRIALPASCNRVAKNLAVLQKFGDDSGHQIELGIYEDNGSGTDPGVLIAHYGGFYTAGAATAFVLDPDPQGFKQQLSNTTTYVWVAVAIQDVGQQIGYDMTSDESRGTTSTAGVWPDPWPTATDTANSDRQYGFKIFWE